MLQERHAALADAKASIQFLESSCSILPHVENSGFRVKPPRITKNPTLNEKVKTYVALVGWESKASHEAFTTTESYLISIEGLLPYLSGDFDSDDKLISLV
ncbi:hypothetical protein BO71DRAFT_430397 [Aspergillus ellipticus CBS 707.79]|uniref:Uncharacterized protein n=1 Tax=Aspergillus ellipticus CBS 707.79 TaxID=1448320 RepID=A0A319EST7_9EURO|nr:hypothetical protein BO71DRAFT_430397 [Aspergillus ellipticus CBS 707.79]